MHYFRRSLLYFSSLLFLTFGAHAQISISTSGSAVEGVAYPATSYNDTIILDAGWNVVSVVKGLPDYRLDEVFPAAISKAFIYSGRRYVGHDTLEPGRGYWVKFGESQQIVITWEPGELDTIDVVDGWNLIGGLICPTYTSTIFFSGGASIPGSPTFFRYNDNGYYWTSVLYPGEAYWLRVYGTGKLIFRCSPGASGFR